jgi:hypothetical protein
MPSIGRPSDLDDAGDNGRRHLVAMRLRVMWLDDLGISISALAPLIDRYAFIAALTVGIVGWFAFRRCWCRWPCLGGLAASIGGHRARRLFADGAPPHVCWPRPARLPDRLLSWHVFGFIGACSGRLH